MTVRWTRRGPDLVMALDRGPTDWITTGSCPRTRTPTRTRVLPPSCSASATSARTRSAGASAHSPMPSSPDHAAREDDAMSPRPRFTSRGSDSPGRLVKGDGEGCCRRTRSGPAGAPRRRGPGPPRRAGSRHRIRGGAGPGRRAGPRAHADPRVPVWGSSSPTQALTTRPSGVSATSTWRRAVAWPSGRNRSRAVTGAEGPTRSS
jgi:hypothetical protein